MDMLLAERLVHWGKGWYIEEKVGTQKKQIILILTDVWYTEEKVGTQRKQIILILTDGWYTDETD